jgi:hypothetical protein
MLSRLQFSSSAKGRTSNDSDWRTRSTLPSGLVPMPIVLSPPRAINADPPRRSHNFGIVCFAAGTSPSTSDTPTYAGRMGVTSSRKREFAPSLPMAMSASAVFPLAKRKHSLVTETLSTSSPIKEQRNIAVLCLPLSSEASPDAFSIVRFGRAQA